MLPSITSLAEYRALDLQAPAFSAAAKKILREPNLEFPNDGSSPLLLSPTHVVKFFGGPFLGTAEVEIAALRFLAAAPGIAPALVSDGRVDGWAYTVMTRNPGQSLKTLWPNLSAAERAQACHDAGAALRRIHDLPVATYTGPSPDWKNFLSGQLVTSVDRQRERGLEGVLLNQIEPFLASVELPSGQSVFLHTEVMRDHAFFSGGKFSGFIDFEPAMIGNREYDFASVGLFLSGGDPAALRAFFAGYGNLGDVDAAFRRRVLAYALLHKYSNLKWYLSFMPAVHSLDEMAETWWAT